MNNLLSRILMISGCLSLSIATFASTSADCTNAQQLSTRGVINYQNACGGYNLDRTITRQEIAAVALKVGETCGSIQNVPPIGQYYCDNIFSDVSSSYPNTWACRVAETLARDGIISQNNQNQYGDVFFQPLKNVTRAESLAMILNASDLDFQGVTYDDWRFTGTGAVSWQKPLMQYAYDRSILSSITSFGPNTNALRRDVFNYAAAALNFCSGNNGNNNYNNNNNYANNCGIGQYSSSNTCYSCNTPPANAYYATVNTCVWTCNSGFYKSGNSCVSNFNNNNQNNLGQCGSTVNTCTRGFSSNISYSGNFAYWNCNGTNGAAVSCSAFSQGNNFGTTAQCGSTANTCTRGFSSNISYNGNNASWNCNGTNGSAVSCNSWNNNNNNNNTSTCGVGQYFTGNMCLGCTSKPSYGYYTTTGACDWMCNSGYYKSGNTCVSTNSNTYCTAGQYLSGNTCYACGTAPYNGYYSTSGSCDWTCNSGFYKSGNSCVSNFNNNNQNNLGQCGSTVNTCTRGFSSNISYSGNNASWNCNGTNGAAVSCSAFSQGNNFGTTAQCGSTANTCTRGFLSNISYNGNFAYWNCNGTNGSAVSCSAFSQGNNFGTTAQCGSTANTCITGYSSNVTYNSNNTSWNCNGTNGSAVSCNSWNNNNNDNNNYNNFNNCSIVMPSNSYYTNSQSCWSCNVGYVQINNMCVWWN